MCTQNTLIYIVYILKKHVFSYTHIQGKYNLQIVYSKNYYASEQIKKLKLFVWKIGLHILK